MAEPLFNRLRNAFVVANEDRQRLYDSLTSVTYDGASYGIRPDRPIMSTTNERSIINSIITRIGIDVASIDIRHVQLDEEGNYKHTIESDLNECLTLDPNLDQTSRPFFQDITMSMMDEGVIAIVPIDKKFTIGQNGTFNGDFDIQSIRSGTIKTWFPSRVKVNVYNEATGKKEDIMVSKREAAIIENPLFSIMNQPNSTLKRLAEKLSLLDAADKKANSGKLDLIIQLPYVIRNQRKLELAKERVGDIQTQLQNSAYGIAYVGSDERVTQLNRPAENTLLAQIEYLTRMLYSQLGMPESVFDGTADEQTMLAYHNRTIEPILDIICDSMKRCFLSKRQRRNRESIKYFRDPFKLVPVDKIAEIADKLTRNEIATGNEIRSLIGWMPSSDPSANELRNKNLNASNQPPTEGGEGETNVKKV